jgi:hypothetical protein
VRDRYYLELPAVDPRRDEVGGKRLLGHPDSVKNDAAWRCACAGTVDRQGRYGSD